MPSLFLKKIKKASYKAWQGFGHIISLENTLALWSLHAVSILSTERTTSIPAKDYPPRSSQFKTKLALQSLTHTLDAGDNVVTIHLQS